MGISICVWCPKNFRIFCPLPPLSLSQISWFCSFRLLFGDPPPPTHCRRHVWKPPNLVTHNTHLSFSWKELWEHIFLTSGPLASYPRLHACIVISIKRAERRIGTAFAACTGVLHSFSSSLMKHLKSVSKVLGQMWALLALGWVSQDFWDRLYPSFYALLRSKTGFI